LGRSEKKGACWIRAWWARGKVVTGDEYDALSANTKSESEAQCR